MGTYASTTDLQARVGGRTIGASTKPSLTEAGYWIDEAESMLTGALASGQCTTPVTNTDGIKIMRAWATDYAEAHARMVWAAAGGDGSNDDGKAQLDRFNAIIDDIFNNPARYDAMLNGGGAGEATCHVRSHVLNNSDSLTVADGDFDPIFEMDEVF